jgi:hypothetical protein
MPISNATDSPRQRRVSSFRGLAIFFLLSGVIVSAQIPDSCENRSVEYESPAQSFENNIHVLRVAKGVDPPLGQKQNLSPQGTRWYVEIDPDYTSTKNPWNTTLYIGGVPHKEKVLLKATFTDHGNSFSAKWINEDLLFIQVWWGHILSSDLILDVHEGKFIYDKLANYDQLGEPCYESK